MKITETINRECCQQKDMRPVDGTPKVGTYPEWTFCIHCGHYHEAMRVTDPAGGIETEYRKRPAPWVKGDR